MADGAPKDYSSMYGDSNLVLTTRRTINKPIPSTRLTGRAYKNIDGSFVPPKHREQQVDLRQVVEKLENTTTHNAVAMQTLHKHYSSVYRRKQTQFKAYIQYYNERDTYIVHIETNTLKAVRDKLPKRDNYRYFFKQLDNTHEEIESDDSIVPFHDKDGTRQIYCQVFPVLKKQ